MNHHPTQVTSQATTTATESGNHLTLPSNTDEGLMLFNRILDTEAGELNDRPDETFNLNYSNGDAKFTLKLEGGLYRIVEEPNASEAIEPNDRKALLELILYSGDLNSDDELYQAAARYQYRLMQRHPDENYGILLTWDRFKAEEKAREVYELNREDEEAAAATTSQEASDITGGGAPATAPSGPIPISSPETTQETNNVSLFTTRKHKVDVTVTFWNDTTTPTYSDEYQNQETQRLAIAVDALITRLNNTNQNSAIAEQLIHNGIEVIYNAQDNNDSDKLFNIVLPETGRNNPAVLRIYPAHDDNLAPNTAYEPEYDLMNESQSKLFLAFMAAKARQN